MSPAYSNQSVCLLSGDGISAELLEPAARAIALAIPGIDLIHAEAGFGTFEATGSALPEDSLEVARSADASLLIAVGSPSVPTPGYRSPIVALRRELDLYANIRPVVSLPQAGQAPAVDLIVVRENTEGLYSGNERSEPGRAVAERVITEAASRRIARVAGELALGRDSRVTVVHKANVLRETCGLFRTAALGELSLIPGLTIDELLVDNAALQVAANPERFDVIVTTNMFGDILSDVASHAGGGLGLVTSANLGEPGTRGALFEPVHGSAPDLVGTGQANPVASLRAAAWLVKHLGHTAAGNQLINSIEHCLVEGPRTPDLGGTATTSEVVDFILARAEAAIQPLLTQASI